MRRRPRPPAWTMRSSTCPRSGWTSTRRTTSPRCAPPGASGRGRLRRWRRRPPPRRRDRRRVAMVTALALRGLPEVRAGDDLAALIAGLDVPLHDGDVLAVAHKIVSKAEGRVVALSSVSPGERALELAAVH